MVIFAWLWIKENNQNKGFITWIHYSEISASSEKGALWLVPLSKIKGGMFKKSTTNCHVTSKLRWIVNATTWAWPPFTIPLNFFTASEVNFRFLFRQLCVLLSAEDIYRSLAELLRSEANLKFARLMVETLNTILLTTSELFELRNRLRSLSTCCTCNNATPSSQSRLFWGGFSWFERFFYFAR